MIGERRNTRKQHTMPQWALGGVALAALAATSNAASAQTATPTVVKDDGGVAQIVVTAQKRSENVQSVPISITAFNAASLQSRGISDITALGNIAPNVTLDAGTPFSGSSAVLSAYIRGIGQDDFAFNLDPGVGVYLDGVYLARSVGANQDLLDIDRVEILKGPQGTLFGRNTIGGAISITTKAPAKEFGAKFEVTTGRFNRIDTKGIVDVPLTSNLFSSFSFATKNNDGYQKQIPYPGFANGVVTDNFNYFGSDHPTTFGGENQYNFRGKVLWEASPDFTATLTADYLRQKNNGVANSLLQTYTDPGNPNDVFGPLYNGCVLGALPAFAQTGICNNIVNGANLNGVAIKNPSLALSNAFIAPSIDTTYGTGPNFSHMRNFGGSLNLDWKLGAEMTLKSITAYRVLHWQSAIDADGTPLPILQLSFDENQHQFSQEFQLTGQALADRLSYVFGIYYFEEGGNIHDLVTFPGGLLQVDGQNYLSTRNYAGYAHLNYKFTNTLSLTLGGRYTHENKTFTGLQSDPNGIFYKLNGYYTPNAAAQAALCDVGATPVSLQGIGPGLFCYTNPANIYQLYPLAPAGGFKQEFNNFSPKLGLEYKPDSDLLVYTSFSQGYKTGGWTTRLTTPQPAGTTAPTYGPEKAITYEAGVKSEFLDRKVVFNLSGFYTDYKGIQLNFEVGTSPVLENAGNARIYGFEAELQTRPMQNLTIAASVGNTNAKYTYLSPFATGVTLDSSLPKTPKWKFTLSPQYSVDLQGHGLIVLSADYTHTTSLFNDTENSAVLARLATDMLGASVTYKAPNDHWELSAGGTNILNDRYLVTGQDNVAGGAAYGTYDRPAEWYVTARVKF